MAQLHVTIGRSEERLLFAHSMSHAVVEVRARNLGFLQPNSQRRGSLANGDQSVSAGVPILRARRRPAAVPRLITTHVVDAVQRVLGAGPASNIAQEHEEVVPCRVDRNTSSTVSRPELASGVVAAVPHLTPCAVLGRFRARHTLTMPATCQAQQTTPFITFHVLGHVPRIAQKG